MITRCGGLWVPVESDHPCLQLSTGGFSLKKFVILALALSVSGCTAFKRDGIQTTEQLLSAAGFREYLPKNDQEQANLKTIPQRQIVSVHGAAKPTYLYADDDAACDCIYVGGDAEYAAYKKLDGAKRGADSRVIYSQRRDAYMSGVGGGFTGGVMGGYW